MTRPVKRVLRVVAGVAVVGAGLLLVRGRTGPAIVVGLLLATWGVLEVIRGMRRRRRL